MGKKLRVGDYFIISLVVIFVFSFIVFGFNKPAFIIAIILSVLDFAIVGGIAQGNMEYKRDKHLANKYDKEDKERV